VLFHGRLVAGEIDAERLVSRNATVDPLMFPLLMYQAAQCRPSPIYLLVGQPLEFALLIPICELVL